MPRRRVPIKIGIICAAALAVAGCSGNSQVFNSEAWFSKPVDIFAKPDWARVGTQKADLGPKGPVGPEDLVGADGSCAPAPAEAAPVAAAAPAPAPEPDRLQTGGGGGAAPAAMPAVAGGISLGMSECQAVRRAGQPGNVAITAENGERKVVLTYLSGPWPGIYTFSSGRLQVIDRVPDQQKPKAPVKKKKAPKRAKNAAHQPAENVFVR